MSQSCCLFWNIMLRTLTSQLNISTNVRTTVRLKYGDTLRFIGNFQQQQIIQAGKPSRNFWYELRRRKLFAQLVYKHVVTSSNTQSKLNFLIITLISDFLQPMPYRVICGRRRIKSTESDKVMKYRYVHFAGFSQRGRTVWCLEIVTRDIISLGGILTHEKGKKWPSP